MGVQMGVTGGASQQAPQASQVQQAPSAPPMPAKAPSTFLQLFAALEHAVDPMDTVSRFTDNPDSSAALAAMPPDDFAAVLHCLSNAGDQTAAAELLAQKARAAGAHLVRALRGGPQSGGGRGTRAHSAA